MITMPPDPMSLQYTNHSTSLSSNLTTLLLNQMHCDVVLACKDGLKLTAHKIILSACSPYFRDLLAETEIHQEIIIVLRDINRIDMKAILDFVYSGSVNVPRDRLKDFLGAANSLKVQELLQNSENAVNDSPDELLTRNDTAASVEIENTCAVKLEPQSFLDLVKSEHVEAIVSDTEDFKVEHLEVHDTRPEGGGGVCNLQVRTDILSSGSAVMIPEPPTLAHHHPIAGHDHHSIAGHDHHPIAGLGQEPQINFPETAQDLVRNRIFGWNQKRALVGLESAEKILTKKPCVCTQCGARFSYRNQLTEHKRTAHD